MGLLWGRESWGYLEEYGGEVVVRAVVYWVVVVDFLPSLSLCPYVLYSYENRYNGNDDDYCVAEGGSMQLQESGFLQ